MLTEVHRCVAPSELGPAGCESVYFRGAAQSVGRDRSRFEATAGATVDLDSYANGFPAGAWHQLTGRRRGVVRARLGGCGRLVLYAVTADGARTVVASWTATGEEVECERDFPLDGPWAWLWLTLEAGDGPATMRGAGFWVDGPVRPVLLGAAITTMDRPDSCRALLGALGRLPAQLLASVVLVDHGMTKLVSRHPDVAAASGLQGRLQSVDSQQNLGGSGGFARAMVELQAAVPAVTHVVLLDDDIILDPETLRRAAALAALGHDGVLGGQMLYASAPTMLHSTGEVVAPSAFIWRTPATGRSRVDLASAAPSADGALRSAHRVDYSGWWLCMVPMATLDALGLALPFVIKWDDVEFGLRARDAGVPTTTMPGVGVWHVPWVEKDTAVDWQVFFLTRNRLVTAALHGPLLPWRLLAGVAARTAEHMVTMAYAASDLAIWGVQAFLDGPDELLALQRQGVRPVLARQADLARRLGERGDQRVEEGVGSGGTSLPPASEAAARAFVPAAARASVPAAVLRAFVWAPRRPRPAQVALAEARVPVLGALDAALVVSPTGAPARQRVRDRALARRQLVDLVRVAGRAVVRWPALRRAYRSRQAELASAQTWRETFRLAGRGPSPH